MEIKVKGWNAIVGRMSEPVTLEQLYKTENVQFQNIVWLQYTGVNDVFDVEIYLGDILEREEIGCNGSYHARYKVIYEKGAFCLQVIRSQVLKKGAVVHYLKNCIRIGDIYTTPEKIAI